MLNDLQEWPLIDKFGSLLLFMRVGEGQLALNEGLFFLLVSDLFVLN
jgi:hypothetical protein